MPSCMTVIGSILALPVCRSGVNRTSMGSTTTRSGCARSPGSRRSPRRGSAGRTPRSRSELWRHRRPSQRRSRRPEPDSGTRRARRSPRRRTSPLAPSTEPLGGPSCAPWKAAIDETRIREPELARRGIARQHALQATPEGAIPGARIRSRARAPGCEGRPAGSAAVFGVRRTERERTSHRLLEAARCRVDVQQLPSR